MQTINMHKFIKANHYYQQLCKLDIHMVLVNHSRIHMFTPYSRNSLIRIDFNNAFN